MTDWKVIQGDCLEVLRTLPDCSVDAVVTDPPYGLSFMGKRWDYDVPATEVWAECLRVLKPGGHLLAFAGTRTQHRMAVRIEDSGFEIRDMIAWVYGSGFPKSHNLSGEWQGWGTALKPALEPITVARKPLAGTVSENVLAHGTGALNIDGCRVAGEPVPVFDTVGGRKFEQTHTQPERQTKQVGTSDAGRWPANLIHDGSDDVLAGFPDSNGSGAARTLKRGQRADGEGWGMADAAGELRDAGTGSAARFFYCAKASKRDRDEGLEGFEARASAGDFPALVCNVCGCRTVLHYKTTCGHDDARRESGQPRRNHHPTVKPTDLMRYLCRLVTPPGGTVLDPFTGSGSTGKAAMLEGFRFIGIEREPEYVEIARARISAAMPKPADPEPPQLSLSL